MNKYVFIAMSIAGIGGGQQYMSNKIRYLTDKGYEVYVFSGKMGKIAVENLKPYQKYIIPELFYSPDVFTQKRREKILCKMIEALSHADDDKVIVECNSIENSKWGEMLAERLRCKSVIFNLQEKHNYSKSEREFLQYKLNRRELLGINKYSIGIMLKSPSFECQQHMVFKPMCSNSVQDCDDNVSKLFSPDIDIRIASIGRTDKAYVVPFFKSFVEYVSLHNDKMFELVFIGAATKKLKNRIINIAQKVSNLHLCFTGALYPIPRRIFSLIDLFISASGSATTSFNEKRPTVRIHPSTAQVCGIMGYNYFNGINTQFDVIEGYSLENAIDDILAKKVEIRYDDVMSGQFESAMYNEYDRQLSISCIESEQMYYDVHLIKKNITKKNILYCIIGHLLGGKWLQRLHKMF